MDNLLLATLLGNPNVTQILSKVVPNSSAPSASAAASNAASIAKATADVRAVLQDPEKMANLAVMQALSDEATRILHADLEKLAAKSAIESQKLGQEDKSKRVDKKKDELPPAKTDHKRKRHEKDVPEKEVREAKASGSVKKYLDKPAASTNVDEETNAKTTEAPPPLMQPKPKQRPVQWVQNVEVEGGILEIWTRFRAKAKLPTPPAHPPPHAVPAPKTPPTDTSKDIQGNLMPPPPPPPLPPLPPPQTPHPDVVKNVAKQMLELKETFDQEQVSSSVSSWFIYVHTLVN